jgi:hypothetical protein
MLCDGGASREDIYYFPLNDKELDLIQICKAVATLQFAGEEISFSHVSKESFKLLSSPSSPPSVSSKEPEKEKLKKSDSAVEQQEPETPVKSRNTEKESPISRRRGRPKDSEPAAAKEVKNPEPAIANSGNQVYDKKDKVHSSHLLEIVRTTFGSEWRNQRETLLEVKSFVEAIDGKVEVCDDSGKVLSSFVDYAKDFFANSIGF